MLNVVKRLQSILNEVLNKALNLGYNLKRRTLNILIALDSFLYVLCTLGEGYPSETFSSAAYRAEKQGKFYGRARPFIDWLFCSLEQDHCKQAYWFCINKYNLPEDMR
jgi:hypothetical protein